MFELKLREKYSNDLREPEQPFTESAMKVTDLGLRIRSQKCVNNRIA